MFQPTPAGETSRPQANLEIHRIYEDITETEICEKCKNIRICYFTIKGFPNSKLCRPCGIYSKKYPTTFISQVVWTEPRDCRIFAYIAYILLTVSTIVALYLLGVKKDVLDAIKFAFTLDFIKLVVFINWFLNDLTEEKVLKKMGPFISKLENMFSFLAITFFLTHVDFLEDIMNETREQIKRGFSHQTRQLSASDDKVTKLTNELGNLKEEITGFKRQLSDFEEHDDSTSIIISSDVAVQTIDLDNLKEELDGLKGELKDSEKHDCSRYCSEKEELTRQLADYKNKDYSLGDNIITVDGVMDAHLSRVDVTTCDDDAFCSDVSVDDGASCTDDASCDGNAGSNEDVSCGDTSYDDDASCDEDASSDGDASCDKPSSEILDFEDIPDSVAENSSSDEVTTLLRSSEEFNVKVRAMARQLTIEEMHRILRMSQTLQPKKTLPTRSQRGGCV